MSKSHTAINRRAKRTLWGDVIPFLLNHREILGRYGGWFALGAILQVTWLANATTSLIQHLPDPLWHLVGWNPTSGLERATAELVAPAFLFTIAILTLRAYSWKHPPGAREAPPSAMDAHEGLVVSLSLFAVPRAAPEATAEIRRQIVAASIPAHGAGPNPHDHLLRMLYQSNWGPFAAAVELHAAKLTHVWLLTTRDVLSDRDLAASCIRFLASNGVTIGEIAIDDANDVQGVRRRVLDFYTEEPKLYGLREDQVIIDITGGTKAMSAGIILATLDEQRHIQYLSQGPATLLVDGQPRRDLSRVFRYVVTSPGDVARAFISHMENRSHTAPGSSTELDPRPE